MGTLETTELPPETSGDVWFTIPEAAQYLNVSEPTVYRWMREGKISFYKVGDATRFKKQNLDMVFEKHTGKIEAQYYGARCVACGHTYLVPGKIQAAGNVHFKPARTRFFTLLESIVRLQARVCPRCGFVQVFGDTEKLSRLVPIHERVAAADERGRS